MRIFFLDLIRIFDIFVKKTTIMSKNNFINGFKSKKTEFDSMISKFMSFKNENGNGVGAGKWFENLLTRFINKHIGGFTAVKLNLSNSDWCIHDIVVSTSDQINLIDVISIKEKAEKETKINSERMDVFMRSLNEKYGFCLGISAKTYKNWDGQLTTSYESRSFLESKHDEIINQTFDVQDFIKSLAKKTDEFNMIMSLNTFDDTKDYILTDIDFNCLLPIIQKVEFKKLKKHSRYYLVNHQGSQVMDFKYGGKTANPFQRGVWLCNSKNKSGDYHGLSEFQNIITGNFTFQGSEQDWIEKNYDLYL